MELEVFLRLFFVSMVATISPGPNFIIIIRNALSYSARAGVFTALGGSLALFIYCFLCSVFYFSLVSFLPFLIDVLKILASLYFMYLGSSMFFSRSFLKGDFAEEHQKLRVFPFFKQGFFCAILNPKIVFFFVGLFAAYIPSDTPFEILILICVLIAAENLAWYSSFSYLLSMPKVRKIFSRYEIYFNRSLAVALFYFGIEILFLRY